MEFLKALEDAKLQGISKEEFVKLWESELKLKQQKEESRILELRLASASQKQNKSVPDDFIEKIESLLKENLRMQQDQIQEMKNSVISQNQIQYQEIAKLLETQAGLIGQVMRCELERAVQQLHSDAISNPQLLDVSLNTRLAPSSYVPSQANNVYQGPTNNGAFFEAHQNEYDAKSTQSVTPENIPQTKKPQPKKKKPKVVAILPEDDANVEYLPNDGTELTILDVQQLVTSGNSYTTPFYFLEDSPCKVRLSLWFGSKNVLIVNLSIMGLSDDPLPAARIFECIGFIKNKNSGAFSNLFEVQSQPLRRLKSTKENHALGSVCLKTSGGSFKDVTFQQLEERGFIINNTIIIKWMAESFEAS
ncbi:hypothetical protein Btru_048424 [Bulinus truncatus]|nr:hypothetical protein Btru_048424 [Bulinus truncatus]